MRRRARRHTGTPRLLVFVNNLPTPYRSHLATALTRQCEQRGVQFELWFMARTEPGRLWPVEPSAWQFRYRFFRGLHPRLRRTSLHLNPGMLLAAARSRPDWMVLGGGWLLPSVVLLVATRPFLFRRTRIYLWSEANAATTTQTGGVVSGLRRLIYSAADGCVVPGEVAEYTVRAIWHIQPRQVLQLPNLVDERLYRDTVAARRPHRDTLRERLDIPREDTVLLISARLHEATKGILNFLTAIAPDTHPNLTILVAGDGPDRDTMHATARAQGWTKVRFLGHRAEDDLFDLLALADLFALPSFSDPNPLAAIEALWAGLPMILSRACGNHPEVVEHGVNGWLVDPHEHSSIRQALDAALAAGPCGQRAMGARSRDLAQQHFATQSSVDAFLDRLIPDDAASP